jgi:PPOX class probable F420-dependent enzyme
MLSAKERVIQVTTKLTLNAIRLIEGKNFAFLATLLQGGAPHVAPVWVDRDGDLILVNTAMGRVKQKNMERDHRVALSIADQNNPYDKVVIRGRVLTQTTEAAEEHIDKLAKKYTGASKYQRHSPNERRIIVKIEPLRIS